MPNELLAVTSSARELRIALTPTAAIQVTAADVRTVRLAFGRSEVGPDVSIQPDAVVAVVDDQARLVGEDPNRWRVAVLHAIQEWHPDVAWYGAEPCALVAALGELTHPLLGELHRAGRTPLGEIPRWGSDFFRATSPTEAARALVGTSATRHLARRLAASLLGDPERIDVDPLALAAASAGAMTADELANVIAAATGARAPGRIVTNEELRTIRTALARYPAARRARLVLDVAERHGAARCAAVMTRLAWVVDRAPRPLPIRLEQVEQLCDRLIPVLVPPPPPAPPARHAEPPAEPRRAMPVRRPPAPDHRLDRWVVPAALATVDGRHERDLTFCVPTSAVELRQWSRLLHNCLDTYVDATAREQTWLIGIRRDGELIGCVEVCPRTRRLKQAQGPRNRALPVAVQQSAIEVLGREGVLHVHGPTPARQ
jgi:hypothetical protein